MESSLFGAYLGAGLAIGLAAIGAAIGISFMVAKAFESVSRQPEVLEKIRPIIFVGIAFIEAVALFALVISILLASKTL